MKNLYSRFLFPVVIVGLLGLVLFNCQKKTPDPTPTPPDQTIKPGVNVGLGAQLVDPADYQKIPLLADPLAGARMTGVSKDPTLPGTYDLAMSTPPVGNQGQQGSCVAWSVAYAARSYFNKTAKNVSYTTSDGKRNDEAIFSPAFVYNQVKVSGCGDGSRIPLALDLVKNMGVCTLKEMPYNPADCDTPPTVDQKQKASAYKIKSWGRINITTNTLRKYLYFDYPIIIAATLDDNFKQLTEKNTTGEYIWKTYNPATASGGHAMVLVGYDDTRKAFKIQNSWSERWANGGYIWLSYDIVQTAIQEAYVMVAGDNLALKPPKVQTGTATKMANGQATITGTIADLGDEPLLGFGICVSTVPELPTTQYRANQTVTAVPSTFTISPALTASRLYFRAFAETPTTIVYGDTASITLNQSTPTGIGKNLLLFHSTEAYALDADNGKIVWKSQNNSLSSAGNLGGVVVGNVYFVNGFNSTAFNLIDGSKRWSRDGISNSFPVSDNTAIYRNTYSLLQALDPNTGALRWQLDTRTLGSEFESIDNNGLTINGDKLYFQSKFKAFTVDVATGRQVQQLSIGGGLTGNPLISNNLLVAANTTTVGTGGGMVGYSVSPFQLKWTSQTANGFFPTLVGTTVYCATFGSNKYFLVALDATTGQEKWRYAPSQGKSQIVSNTFSVDANSVAIVVTDVDGDLNKNNLQLIDAVTGKLRWEKTVSPSSYGPLLSVSKVYAKTGTDSNTTITAFDVSTGAQVWQSPSLGVFFPSPMCLITADGKTFYSPQSGMQQ